eukprot:5732199-Pleurochrysis_carterae.AAC.2
MKIAQTLFPLKLTEGSPTFFVARLREDLHCAALASAPQQNLAEYRSSSYGVHTIHVVKVRARSNAYAALLKQDSVQEMQARPVPQRMQECT